MDKETLKKVRESIAKAKELAKKLEPEIEKARMAGVDVTSQLKELRELKMRIDKMELVYKK